ncbi:MAG: gamma-glutamyl-gamma-aminobutyrate hydrolase family protein [Actinomycetes bacterium]
MRALVIANTGDDDAGYVGERLRGRDVELVIGYRDSPGGLPSTLDGFDLVVMLGSDWSTYWEHLADEVERESALVREAGVRDLPVLGICYGAQLLAHALGGAVHPAQRTEIGWFTLDTEDENLAPPGPWFEFHIDAFTPPPGAKVLAWTLAGPQAFRIGRMLAWQFHPEVSPEIVRRWGAGSRDQAERAGVDLAAMLSETDEQCKTSRARCYALVDAFLDEFVGVNAR